MTDTYCIYRIVCFATGKCYVGQTMRSPKTRETEHWNFLDQGKHHSLKLQNAYKKYAFKKPGVRGFYYEPIESGILGDGIDDCERYWIAYYDSYRKGYNMTTGGRNGSEGGNGGAPGFRCSWNSVDYESITECAKANSVTPTAMAQRLNCGYACDQDLRPRRTKIVFDGREWNSITEAAHFYGIGRTSMSKRIQNGYNNSVEMPGHRWRIGKGKPVEWNGVIHPTITAFANAYGITHASARERLKKGYACDADMQRATS